MIQSGSKWYGIGLISRRTAHDKKVTNKDCMKLCNLLKKMHVQVEDNDVDKNAAGYGIIGSFVEDSDKNYLNDSEWE